MSFMTTENSVAGCPLAVSSRDALDRNYVFGDVTSKRPPKLVVVLYTHGTVLRGFTLYAKSPPLNECFLGAECISRVNHHHGSAAYKYRIRKETDDAGFAGR